MPPGGTHDLALKAATGESADAPGMVPIASMNMLTFLVTPNVQVSRTRRRDSPRIRTPAHSAVGFLLDRRVGPSLGRALAWVVLETSPKRCIGSRLNTGMRGCAHRGQAGV